MGQGLGGCRTPLSMSVVPGQVLQQLLPHFLLHLLLSPSSCASLQTAEQLKKISRMLDVVSVKSKQYRQMDGQGN